MPAPSQDAFSTSEIDAVVAREFGSMERGALLRMPPVEHDTFDYSRNDIRTLLIYNYDSEQALSDGIDSRTKVESDLSTEFRICKRLAIAPLDSYAEERIGALLADFGCGPPAAANSAQGTADYADTTIDPMAGIGLADGAMACPGPEQKGRRVNSFKPPIPMCIVFGTVYTAVIATSEGAFTVALDPRGAPLNVNAFVYLARYGFYNGLKFDRIVPGFIVQGGDPIGDGTGGPGFVTPDELTPGMAYSLGSVAMANAGPNTNGSQFFVVSGPLGRSLPGAYPIIGHVTSGLDVVRRIDALGVAPGPDGAERPPVRPITIERISILESVAPTR